MFQGAAFNWYPFHFGEKTVGELLAVFELVEVDPVMMFNSLVLFFFHDFE